MRPTVRIEPPLAALLAGLFVLAALPAAAAEATGQIYQQRAADGRIVLTDRPSATSVTERTWQVEREDPAAARQRAFDVRREAEAVSERVQRRIDAQERIANAEMERERQYRRERELLLARADEERSYGTVIVAPYPYRGIAHRHPHGMDPRPPSRRPDKPGQPSRPWRVNEPGSPGSR